MARVLHLTLKKKWFDMIASGEKKEEYREIKPFWSMRFIELKPHDRAPLFNREEHSNICFDIHNGHTMDSVLRAYRAEFRQFDSVCFINGYRGDSPRMTVEFKGIDIGTAKPEWSDNWQGNMFRIKLGKILTNH